jgi:GT2 family glycosyltransferase
LISRLILSCLDPSIVASYARQIPRFDAPIDEVVRLQITYPPSVFGIPAPWRNARGVLRFLSNACALIRRDAWGLVKFDELCSGAEEIVWMEELLTRGYSYTYVPDATVFHSHRDSLSRGAYRLWELHHEEMVRSGRRLSLGNIIRAGLSIFKRRMINVVFARVSLRSRIEGLVSLPFEVALFIFIGLLEGIGFERSRLRLLMWNK